MEKEGLIPGEDMAHWLELLTAYVSRKPIALVYVDVWRCARIYENRVVLCPCFSCCPLGSKKYICIFSFLNTYFRVNLAYIYVLAHINFASGSL